MPKQFLPIASRRSLLQDTARRLRPLFSWRQILVVTGAGHVDAVRHQLPRLPPDNVLAEPMGRDTAACAALAAEWIHARVGDAVLVMAPADHIVKDTKAFTRVVRTCIDVATAHDCLVTMGVEPTAAETGYGYVEVARAIPGVRGAAWVRRFHEKPPVAAARRYAASGRHYWNSGMFVWRASVFRAALNATAPRLLEALAGLWDAPRSAPRRLARAYRRLPAVPVDVAVLEQLTARRVTDVRVAMVRAAFGWSDVGTWVTMPELWGANSAGITAVGRVVAIDATDSVVYAPRHVVALIGVDNLIVVESHDALLVCRRDRAQDIRKIGAELKRRGWNEYL